MKKKARYEFEAPESCAECDFRMFNECPTDGHVNEEYSDSRSPDCPLKIVPSQSCELCGSESGTRITFNKKFVCHECWEGLVALHIKSYGDEPELEPCPFCGGEAVLTNYAGSNIPVVECKNCYAKSPGEGDSDEAIAAWNRREG